MAAEQVSQDGERIRQAIAEIQGIIATAFPEATFEIYQGYDPDGTYLEATVDVDDVNDVMDVYIDRLVDMQVEERLPVYVIPVHTPGRVARLVAEAEQRLARAAALKQS